MASWRASASARGLPQAPALYYVPSRMLNAFAVGQRHEVAIALTDGLLRHLTLRELAGVLAHEVGHVRNHDLWIMGLADAIGRLTSDAAPEVKATLPAGLTAVSSQ
jgi:heat shock protein HtpX